jgi:hypothetical protein
MKNKEEEETRRTAPYIMERGTASFLSNSRRTKGLFSPFDFSP